jgi:hypothetical protein
VILWVDTVQQGIADLLAAELPALLPVIEEDYHDGVKLDLPIEIWPCDKARVNSTPAIEVWCPDANPHDQETDAINHRARFTIVWTIAGTDEVEIDKRVKRYILATIAILNGQLVAGAGPLVIGPSTFLVVDNGNAQQPFARCAAVEFSALLETVLPTLP